MQRRFLSALIFLFFSCSLHAQIEKIIVETYYVSDSADATNTTGGALPVGSKTYRIYIDLKPGAKLRKIYGDPNHPLKFFSTANFYNNKTNGQTFAKNFSKSSYSKNTVALDTWLTLGQTTDTSGSSYFGILKEQDTDGSFIGGVNNDGGSKFIPKGLLTNDSSLAGIPVTTADGMVTMPVVPTSWSDYGFKNPNSGKDASIFGSDLQSSQFISYNAGLQNSGVGGVNPDSNQVLIAQLTTPGDISFELNLEVQEFYGTNSKIVEYVANGDKLLSNEIYSPILKYPPVCGCTDPNFLEYKSSYACSRQDSCKTKIVFGCADPLACNYNADANFNLQEQCCYIGYCNDRDISVVCPNLSVEELKNKYNFETYPNPAQKYLTVKINSQLKKNFSCDIYNLLGESVLKNVKIENESEQLDVSKFPAGLYLVRLLQQGNYFSKTFIKN